MRKSNFELRGLVNIIKLPVTQKLSEAALASLKKEMDRLFDEFSDDFWRRPFRPVAAFEWNWPKKFATAPAVDVAETDKSYEITAEMPGMDEKNIEVMSPTVESPSRAKRKKGRKKRKRTITLRTPLWFFRALFHPARGRRCQ